MKNSKEPSFIHLHLHTEYSIVDGLIQIPDLLETCESCHMPAIAMTDLSNLFGMVKFYKAAEATGIKPIVGSEILIKNQENAKNPFHLVLLCQNLSGYRNLTRLISKAYTEGQEQDQPLIHYEWLTSETTAGLIALSGAQPGDIGQALLSNDLLRAEKLLHHWLQLFSDRFYIELQRVNHPYEEEYIHEALVLAEKYQIPVVASNDVRFLTQEDYDAHEARVCIYGGWTLEDRRRPQLYTPEQYLKSTEQMQSLFADIPEALTNSVEIAKRCNLELTLDKAFLPNFPLPETITISQYLAEQAENGLQQRFITLQIEDPSIKQKYQDRLQMELTVINNMGFAGYFLIVADFISWAKQQKIPVGPGRGSGAGSLVAYALGITDLDPITHHLLFERFLNPERVSMPDFDIDFCMEGRDRVIDYVMEKYGRESVSQIITFGTMAARAVVRDVGRVMGFPYGFVDKIAKLIPFEIGMTLKKALQIDEQLLKRFQEEDDVRSLINLALKLEGIARNAGKHAGGVVIAPSVLTDFVPLYCEADGSNLVTQFDKDDVETIGLVKFDFLGLRTLTIIDWAVQTINAKRLSKNESVLDINAIPLDDELAYQLLQACKTTAIFQFESRSSKDLVKRLQPNCFNDITDLGALIRPGPLQSGMVEDFINRRHGRAKIEYPHPLLESVLKSTYGVILYQEQVIQIAQVLAGYSLGKADLLRRAMGKKKPEEMAKHRAIFVDGATQRGVDGHLANEIFDLMEKFSGYGFNRSHSAAYAVITYQTAWLKAHYPAEFMAAVLSSDMDNTDKVVIFIDDCRNLGLELLPPDINHSYYKFTVSENNKIIYGLGAIKGMGAAAIENLISVREKIGEFTDLFSFCQQVDTRKINRRVLESLIRAGAMDSFQIERSSLLASIDLALQMAEQQANAAEMGQDDLFADSLTSSVSQKKTAYVSALPWSEAERLAGENETLGLYLTGHPINQYEKELQQLVSTQIVDLKPTKKENTMIVAGLIVALKILNTKSGNRIAFLTLDDRTARVEIAVFSEVFVTYRNFLQKNQIIVVEGEVSMDEFSGNYRLNATRLFNIEQARLTFAKSLWLKLTKQQLQPIFIEQLKNTLHLFLGGHCPIYISYDSDDASTRIALGQEWKVKPLEKVLEELHKLCGRENVVLCY